MGNGIRLVIALFASGMLAALSFAVVFAEPMQYVTLLVIASPVAAILSVGLGGLTFWALHTLRIRMTYPICILIGILIGSIPGMALWLTSGSPSPTWSATAEAREAAWYPLIFSFFGGVGGYAFAVFSRWFGLR